MSTASKGFVRPRASITTPRCGRTVWHGSMNCAPAMDAHYQRALKAEIVRELKRLEVLLEMIATVEAERDAILKECGIDASQC